LKKDDNKDLVTSILAGANSESWDADLTEMLTTVFTEIYSDSILQATAQFCVSFQASSEDIFQGLAQDYASQRTADLVTKLDDTTKEFLKNDLTEYMKEGLTPAQIAIKLQNNYAFSESRAYMIARTETGFVWNHAGINTLQLGGAKGVKVFDGDYDGACAAANGQNWSFTYAMEHLLQHPRCVRSFGPMADDESFDQGGDELGNVDITAADVLDAMNSE
jgi:hypothetical protein